MNVKKNPFSKKTPSQRLLLQGGTPYNIEENKPTSKVSGILYSTYNPVLITPSTLDELVSAKGELNFYLIYNLIKKWMESPDKREWDPKEAAESVFDDLKEKKPEQFDLILADKLNFVAWFQDIPGYERDFLISNPPKQSLVIHCSSSNPQSSDEAADKKAKDELAAQSRRLPLGHFLQSPNKMNDPFLTYDWLSKNYLTREFAWVRPSVEQYKLIDLAKYTMGSASMLTNGLPGVGKSTDLQIAAIELLLQPGPNRDSRKILYLTHDLHQKRIAKQEINSILRVTYCATDELVERVLDSIQFESRKNMFGTIFHTQTPELETSNFKSFLLKLGISEPQYDQEKEFYQAATENFLKVVLGWFGSISKFREITRNKTFKQVMDSKIQLFKIHENQMKDEDLPTMKMDEHWKGGRADPEEIGKWSEKDWNNFNQLLNKISDSNKLRSYENDLGEYWTYSINCAIADKAYRMISEDENIQANPAWDDKFKEIPSQDINLGGDTSYLDVDTSFDDDISIWSKIKKNKFDAIIVDEVQNFSPISLSVLLKHQSNRLLKRDNPLSRSSINVYPFILKASGDEWQSMTSNTFFENNRHAVDVFNGWRSFTGSRGEGVSKKSGTGLVIDTNNLNENHRNSEPILKLLNDLYQQMSKKSNRTPQTNKIKFSSGSKSGALINLKYKGDDWQPKEFNLKDLLSIVAESLIEQISLRDEENYSPSRNTFLIIPPEDMDPADEKIETIIKSIMKHMKAFFQEVWKDEEEEIQNKLDEIKKHLEDLEVEVTKSSGVNDIPEYRYLLLSRGIASVNDVQGLTVEVAIVSGLRGEGRDEFRHKQEAFVAFSRPRKMLIISEPEKLGPWWRNNLPIKNNIKLTEAQCNEYTQAKKGTDFHLHFQQAIQSPNSPLRWRNTLRAITYAKKGYSSILRDKDNSLESPDKESNPNAYDALEKIITRVEMIFVNYYRGKLLETWEEINSLEKEIKELDKDINDKPKLPRELFDFRDLFEEESFFKLKHYLALQFLHRYGEESDIRDIAPEWINKLDSFFEELCNKWKNEGRASEYALYIIFHNSLKLIHNNLGQEDIKNLKTTNEEATINLVPAAGYHSVSTLKNPLKGKGHTKQSNLERTISVGLNQDLNWNFPLPNSPSSSFHYMYSEGEWSLHPQQIYHSFHQLMNELKKKDIIATEHKLICESTALSYFNDDDDSIIKLINDFPIASEDAINTIDKLLKDGRPNGIRQSPQKHPALFKYLVESTDNKNERSFLASKIIEKAGDKQTLQEVLEHYKEALETSSPEGKNIYYELIRKIEADILITPLKNSDKSPWFVRDNPVDDIVYSNSKYAKHLSDSKEVNSVRYSFDLYDTLISDWIKSNSPWEPHLVPPRDKVLKETARLLDMLNPDSQNFPVLGDEGQDGTLPWSHYLIEALIDTDLEDVELKKRNIHNETKILQPESISPHLEFIILKRIEDEGVPVLKYILGNYTTQTEGVDNDVFLWGKMGIPHRPKRMRDDYLSINRHLDFSRLKAKVALCVFISIYSKNEKIKGLASNFLREIIIAISLNYIQNKPMKAVGKAVAGQYDIDLREIWKLIIPRFEIDNLFGKKPWTTILGGTNYTTLHKNFGNTNEGENDKEIFDNIRAHIGFQNWPLLDMSLQSGGSKLRNTIWYKDPEFNPGLLKGSRKTKGILGDNDSQSDFSFLNKSASAPLYHRRNWNKYLLGSLPNRPIDGSKSLVRYQYLNKYTFKIIDSIIRKQKMKLEKNDYIHSGLIEEWVFQQLKSEDYDKKEILTAIIQTMNASNSESNNIPDLEKILKRLNGSIKRDKKNSKIIFSFEIFNRKQIHKKYSKEIFGREILRKKMTSKQRKSLDKKKTYDKKLRVREKIAEILAYLPYLAALNDEKRVHAEIIIPKEISVNLENEYIKEKNPGEAGTQFVLTLIPLYKEHAKYADEKDLPISNWYKENIHLIRNINPSNLDSPNLFMSQLPGRHVSLFRYNNLHYDSPLVQIAALLDTATSDEIEKQLLTYYPSLKLLDSSESSGSTAISDDIVNVELRPNVWALINTKTSLIIGTFESESLADAALKQQGDN